MKYCHNKHVKRGSQFEKGDWELLLNWRLRLFLGKLKSIWVGSFTVTQVFPYGTVEIMNPDKGTFKVTRHRLKKILGHESEHMGKKVLYLHEPP